MVALAKMVFDLIIPCEDRGRNRLTRAERDQFLVRKLFEKAIGNFFGLQLREAGVWKVYQGRRLVWQTSDYSDGIADILPSMKTDIILESQSLNQRIVIDTKFTGVFTRTQYREAVLKSGYLYQMYAYLRSQEKDDEPLSMSAEGLFIHPAVGFGVDEDVRIQGRRIRFTTLDLTLPSNILLQRLGELPFSSRGVSADVRST
jgi:5-methylcytosine-specific restriction enzyme subunit McrC